MKISSSFIFKQVESSRFLTSLTPQTRSFWGETGFPLAQGGSCRLRGTASLLSCLSRDPEKMAQETHKEGQAHSTSPWSSRRACVLWGHTSLLFRVSPNKPGMLLTYQVRLPLFVFKPWKHKTVFLCCSIHFKFDASSHSPTPSQTKKCLAWSLEIELPFSQAERLKRRQRDTTEPSWGAGVEKTCLNVWKILKSKCSWVQSYGTGWAARLGAVRSQGADSLPDWPKWSSLPAPVSLSPLLS